jgi:hypothetical protein
VDLVQPASERYASLAISRALAAPLRYREITLLAPEDVVVFKVLSTRERDLEDAVAILHQLRGQLAFEAIEPEIDRLAAEIPKHDVRGRWRRCHGS